MTIKEFYMDCLRYEKYILVYYIQHLLKEQKINLDDDLEELDFNKADHNKVRELILTNPLGFKKIDLFELSIDRQDSVFIFAANEEDAIGLFQRIFQRMPMKVDRWPLDLEVEMGSRTISFRDLKKYYDHFPVFLGYKG